MSAEMTSTIPSDSAFDPQAQENPTLTQQKASDPSSHVWVSASAGTGKTKVLTDRVLRLLLPGLDGQPPAAPHTILGITFTKAAANEMQLRILKTLSQWAVISEPDLVTKLTDLLGRPPRADQIADARSLFTRVIDLPKGLSIMTIDSFCESILARFPMEAGLQGGFEILDDLDKPDILQSCLDDWLSAHGLDVENRPLLAWLDTSKVSEKLEKLIDGDIPFAPPPQGPEPEEIWQDYLAELEGKKDLIRQSIQAVEAYGTEKEKERYTPLKHWLEGLSNLTAESVLPIFLTGSYTILASLLTNKVKKNAPAIELFIEKEAERVLKLHHDITHAILMQDTAIFARFAMDIKGRYAAYKQAENLLDFGDLVRHTARLLKTSRAHLNWVMYKLDGGIQHILLDEAQDTNRAQWDIITALSDGFFEEEEAAPLRSLFVVGDDKQSIYGFRGAESSLFSDMRSYFRTKAKQASQPFIEVDMTVSFRSGQAVLDVVNAMMDRDDLRRAMTDMPRDRVQHSAWRTGQAGSVEIWPLITDEERTKPDEFSPTAEILGGKSAAQRLSTAIAERIDGWLKNGVMLESRGRPIEPRDILILFKSRSNEMYRELNAALLQLGIPVSGTDRIRLEREIAALDILCALRFALLPGDDLTLATLLKSPFIRMEEADLYSLAQGRGGRSLWDRVRNSDRVDQVIQDWLSTLIRLAGSCGPFAFLGHVLNTPCPSHAVSGRAALCAQLGLPILDTVEELSNQATIAQFQKRQTLESFLNHMDRLQGDIKREQTEGGNAVSLMTVHGAKGLQAPIVILPAAVERSQDLSKPSDIQKPERGVDDTDYAYWSSGRGGEHAPAYTDRKEALKQREINEYQRLLYVAATRAEDHLLVCGVTKQKPAEASWHHSFVIALQSIPGYETQPFFEAAAKTSLSEDILRITCPQTDAAEDKKKEHRALTPLDDIPGWITQPAQKERPDERPLSPSRSDEMDIQVPVPSPLIQDENGRFLRGNLTHSLLQILPALPDTLWAERAKTYIETEASGMSETFQNSVHQEVLSLLRNPDYADLFGPDSRAEIPLAGMVDGRPVSGQIDRLVVRGEEVLIIDYKTNRPAPKEAQDIPDLYRKQMHLYSALVGQIYPGKTIRPLLLWTQNGQIMEL